MDQRDRRIRRGGLFFGLRRDDERAHRAESTDGRGANNTRGRDTSGRSVSPLIDACRLPVGRSVGCARPVQSSRLRIPPGLNAVAGAIAALRRRAPSRRKRSITRPRDHVTVWPLFHAIISLSICPNDARPIRPPPPISRSPPPTSYPALSPPRLLSLSLPPPRRPARTCTRRLPAQCAHCLPHARIIHPHYARGRVRTRLRT